jgi:hypothetical protein
MIGLRVTIHEAVMRRLFVVLGLILGLIASITGASAQEYGSDLARNG